MINSSIFNYVNVLDKAADASWIRNDLISNNIANANTPNYKRKDITFEAFLQNELAGSDTNNLANHVSKVDMNYLNGQAYTDMADLSYRLDGNNVDIDTENVELASNQIRYNALINSISHQFTLMKTAMTTS